jgi:hypothetical protein
VVFGDLDYGTPVLPYDQMPDAMALINPANMYAGTIDYGPIAELLSESLARLQEKGISEEGLALRYALPRSDSANGLPSLTGDFNQSAAHEFDVYSSKMGIIYEVSGSTRLRDPDTGAILPVGLSVQSLGSSPLGGSLFVPVDQYDRAVELIFATDDEGRLVTDILGRPIVAGTRVEDGSLIVEKTVDPITGEYAEVDLRLRDKPIKIDFGDAGATLGSTFGRYLAGDDLVGQ